jgi:hypothetical protein
LSVSKISLATDKKIYKGIINWTGKKSITVDRQLVLADGKDDDDDFKECSGYECMTVITTKNIFTRHQKQKVNMSSFHKTTREKLSYWQTASKLESGGSAAKQIPSFLKTAHIQNCGTICNRLRDI